MLLFGGGSHPAGGFRRVLFNANRLKVAAAQQELGMRFALLRRPFEPYHSLSVIHLFLRFAG
ncbi:hypothetical protein D3C75_657720 [compost metagenome]